MGTGRDTSLVSPGFNPFQLAGCPCRGCDGHGGFGGHGVPWPCLALGGGPRHDRTLVTPSSPTPAQFPSLQSKMRVVLRVEVEAVKFLKEEPNRLDGLLKRCKTVTDTLAQIRRSA